eukprot:TRINITY_DN12506_c0_g1_i2.p1 TRINITY_DN12506_c0_g1~~TRINITY_DN12506_c0_g1_i2.p1  ORF type:complete len:200 (-),score=3.59 TRINITY_DN12506_c0_g1_i2:157-684(-)
MRAAANGSRPYSSFTITRVEDGSSFVSYGSNNDVDSMRLKGAKGPTITAQRVVAASLLAGFTYRVRYNPPPTSPSYIPPTIYLRMLDVGGCQGPLTVIMEPPPAATMQWLPGPNNMLAPCPGAARDATKSYRRAVCDGSRALVTFDIGSRAIMGVGRVDLGAAGSGSAACPVPSC